MEGEGQGEGEGVSAAVTDLRFLYDKNLVLQVSGVNFLLHLELCVSIHPHTCRLIPQQVLMEQLRAVDKQLEENRLKQRRLAATPRGGKRDFNLRRFIRAHSYFRDHKGAVRLQ